ncbi:monofunctional biosynthetic peptidoglycan transglycosylase [Flavobacterium supellecticarium]|uniref:Biosynthetic peptidoglycan transglycosylase n=1 Tax=Flavobacterium supellecticarium TaxID=2565924 RepID=A0A4S3ZUG7_9FLAO|nr:monofunctional biosynthetic peptidoglycan transglycosylase [Flavobacterium supellecticarium]THF49418.1 monofunctional biosynthetic peptidoglycan transglycosylase [Flavobacterium supellecticarium]
MAVKKTSKTNTKPKSKDEKRSFGNKVARFCIKVFLWFFAISLFFVILFKFVPVPFTPLMAIRAMETRTDGKEKVCKHDWVPLEDISENLQKAVIASEDGTFLDHNGFDFSAMQKAFSSNQKGRKLKGGSTISQQTAKNVFLWQGRSYLRKGLEAYFTVLIELIWGKERIMEVYLNSIEMGDGIYGAQAASEFWYGKSAKNLSKYEAAGIAAILPSPRRFKASNSSAYINKRKDKIVRVMRHIRKLEY